MFPAVIPVAGVGTRSLPASKVIPKEMLPVYDRPIIQHIVEEAVQAGCSQVIFVSSKGKTAIEDHFDRQPELEEFLQKKNKPELLEIVQGVSRLVQVCSVRQKEALGLGHAVGMAEKMISNSHFFVLLGDEMTVASPSAMEQMLHVWNELGAGKDKSGVVMLMEVPESEVSKYGICEIREGRIERCIEKPKSTETKSRWAITGRYLLPTDCFQEIQNSPRGKSGEIQLTDALEALAKQGRLYPCFFKGKRFDAGDRLGFMKANLHYYLESPLGQELRAYIEEVL